MLFEFAVTAIITTLKSAALNPQKKAVVKKAALKIYRLIGALYADDPDFVGGNE